jgi:hypothetical protein
VKAPIVIADTPSGFHLADYGSATAWCGAKVGGGPTFELEPGSDMGEGSRDCPRCVAKLREMGK